MKLNDLVVLIPAYSIEDLPSEVHELQAASLLNAFAAAWHPVLLANAKVLPSWQRADEPPELAAPVIVFVPEACAKRLPRGWADQQRDAGSVVLEELIDRQSWVEAALDPLRKAGPLPSVDPDLVADFYALGTAYVLMDILTRHMHYYNDVDEVYLQREAVAAAEAAVVDDAETARAHLRNCFESLTDSREHFYPVESFLLDLCLLDEQFEPAALKQLLSDPAPINLVASAATIQKMAKDASLVEQLKQAWAEGRVDFCGGSFREIPSLLSPLDFLLWEFRHGLSVYQQILGRRPLVWGQATFGLCNQLPQILRRFGFSGALHTALDDGLCPDTDQSKLRWQGCDGTVIEAIGRKPLAADKASSYMDLAVRMAESMEHDPAAAMVLLIRRLNSDAGWLEDLRRMQRYSPVLGRLVTLQQFFQESDSPGRLSSFDATQYRSGVLAQAASSQQPDPISRHVQHFRRAHQLRIAQWQHNMARLLGGRPADVAKLEEAYRLVDGAYHSSRGQAAEQADCCLGQFATESAKELKKAVLQGAGSNRGWLVFNPLSFKRTVVVDLPKGAAPPPVGGPVLGVQFDENRRSVLVEVPGCGFAWFPDRATEGEQSVPKNRPKKRVALAEETCLRNEFFEAFVNEKTGGLLQLNTYQRSANRLSQQLAFRFPWPRNVGRTPSGEVNKSYYSEMRCRQLQVTSDGPEMGEIVTEGELIDQVGQIRLARFRQVFRVWRHRPVLEIEIELKPDQLPQAAPWASYYASRFAWNDPLATLTRSVLETAQPADGERIEAPEYLEIASERQRTTLLFGGLAFHRKTGPRMLDTLLVTSGESCRRFRIWVAVDQDFPLQAAWDMLAPPTLVRTEAGPPRVGATAWLLHVDAKNVQLTELRELLDNPLEPAASAQTPVGTAERQRTGESDAKTSGEPTAGQIATASQSVESEVERKEVAAPAQSPGSESGKPADSDQSPEPTKATSGDRGKVSSLRAVHSAQHRPRSQRLGFAARLVETEGRDRLVRLRCFRQPTEARKRDFEGRLLCPLTIEGDAVAVELTAYEIAEVELYFD